MEQGFVGPDSKYIDKMTDYSNITTILLDVGHTLVKPRSGSWILPTRYEELLGEEMLRLTRQQPGVFESASKRAMSYLEENHYILTEAEEYEQFRTFYSMIYTDCGLAPQPSTIDALAHEEVFDRDKFIWFDDVVPMLDSFRKRYTLGVISDTWPSLEPIFVAHNLRDYFEIFVMSAIYGVTKQKPALFEVAIGELGIQPGEAVFVDDSEANLDVAAETGLVPILIDRYGAAPKSNYPVIAALEDLNDLLTGRSSQVARTT